MSYLNTATDAVVSALPAERRAGFIRRTYSHLLVAIAVYAGLVSFFIYSGVGELSLAVLSGSKWSWLLILAAWILISVVADKWARDDHSQTIQYAGLSLYVFAFAVLSVPLLYIATNYAPGVIQNAAILTAALVGGLTYTVFVTRKDFSMLAPVVGIGMLVAIGVIVASIIFELQLGMFFAAAMVILAAFSILYTTSNILHVYREEQHVAASLALFSSVGMMFWYLVQFSYVLFPGIADLLFPGNEISS